MEQNNLVVTPDGKTWDEVTRDTSYIGNVVCHMNTDTVVAWSNFVIFDEWRGTYASSDQYRKWFTKDFAIAYDRMICLRDGEYEFYCLNYSPSGQHQAWTSNGKYISGYGYTSEANQLISTSALACLKRGDYVQLRGNFGQDSLQYNDAYIKRVD